MSPEHTYSLVA